MINYMLHSYLVFEVAMIALVLKSPFNFQLKEL